ncbi:DUF2786 domain-containing protein [Streptomyces sp. 891-h]|uniref:DUF2786 domain-containing protein n=1 Tax=Streptomyces sp. 891-h TaxID=2720714 RepID=UPI001FAA6A3E|nr:DUF2786 domain-containing protein [Streptomyces sp. 891-h]UNZ18209.1 DUF2786 domain-containing protein [Streptomyces sp. 891-h]
MSTTKEAAKLETIRALLAKAEDARTPEAEAELARKRAFEMMAKYGVERAMLADEDPSTDAPANRHFKLDNPWAMHRTRLLCFVAEAVGCQAIHLGKVGNSRRVHVFGYESDIHRAHMLYASLRLQMHGALDAQRVPSNVTKPKAWRHAWQLGFIDRVVERLEESERAARDAVGQETSGTGRSGALVLADRAAVIEANFHAEYPRTRTQRSKGLADGFGYGRVAGNRADIGQTARVGGASSGALTR